jgi:hypothetical protein
MLDTLANILPWFGRGKATAGTAESTQGGSETTRWVVVARNLGPAEAMIIKGRLESEEIPSLVQQEALGVVLGLTVGPLGSAQLLVPELLVERALAILADTFEQDEAP